MQILNKIIVSTIPLVPRSIVKHFASRYIAGEELSDAVNTVRFLNSQNMMATMDVLGESITKEAEAIAAKQAAITTLNTIFIERLDSNLSVKLTQLGLKLDKEFCYQNVSEIVKVAADFKNFVRIDMEDSSCTDDTIEIYMKLRKDYSNVGIVLQAYLKRTESDARMLMNNGLKNFRLCKGIYIESPAIAFKKKSEINQNFMKVLKIMFENKAYVGIATHDEELVKDSYNLISEMKLEKNEYEFQMLLGVRPELRSQIVRDGHHLRVYVPYGHHWYKYSIRRFKENPEIAGYVFKSIFTRNTFK